MKSWKRFVAVVLPVFAAGVLVFACDAEDEEAGTPKKPVATDATVATTDASGGSDAATGVPGLCKKVGGPANVAAISDDIFTKASADCRIGVYFTAMGAQGQTHVKECMRKQLQEIFTCPDAKYQGSKSSTGRDCRSMTDAHDELTGPEGKPGLNKADFQAYREVAIAAFKAGNLADTDLNSVMAVFLGYEGQVAPRQITTYNTNCTCPNGVFPGDQKACIPDGGYILPPPPDAGTDTGADTGGGIDSGTDTGAVDAATD